MRLPTQEEMLQGAPEAEPIGITQGMVPSPMGMAEASSRQEVDSLLSALVSQQLVAPMTLFLSLILFLWGFPHYNSPKCRHNSAWIAG